MIDLTLKTAIKRQTAIVDAVLNRGNDHRAFVFAPNDNGVERAKRVQNWSWLRKQACGYYSPGLLHPVVGVTFSVHTWRYERDSKRLPIPIEYFDPIFMARLDDGRVFADQWASTEVLYQALSRWRNARGYLCDWEHRGTLSTPACAIGGLDWKSIEPTLAEYRRRQRRERDLRA